MSERKQQWAGYAAGAAIFTMTSVLAACGGGNGSGSGSGTASSGINETVLWSFKSDGVAPQGKLIQATDGNFYGVTNSGGKYGMGTVFKIDPSGVETILHNFAGGTLDGANPTGSLVQDNNGNLYGMTNAGGSNNLGIVFSITTAGAETVVHNFTGGFTDGSYPQGGMIAASDGNIYGTTSFGGANGAGTVFRISPSNVETVLHSFAGGLSDGSYPVGLIQASNGTLYGMTLTGGASGKGTVFSITTSGTEAVLHNFGGTGDGAAPGGNLIQASDGSLYGLTGAGGTNNSGTAFSITTGGLEKVLYSFGAAGDGATPSGSLVQASDGNLYGITSAGGGNNLGTLFRITTGGTETVLHTFGGTGDGSQPDGGLIQAKDGNLYGVTLHGGSKGAGTVLKATTSGTETVLHNFDSTRDAAGPYGPVVQASDGNFYGTTYGGGSYGQGAVFKITPNGTETVLHSFGGTGDGTLPIGSLVQASDGNFYGTTYGGGTYGLGTVFKITATGTESVLWSFGNSSDGANPEGELIQASDGNLYGLTAFGGIGGLGTAFKITMAGSETVLWSFGGAGDGFCPVGRLLQASDGNLYGLTTGGGVNGTGAAFKLTTAGAETVLWSFGGTGDGKLPYGSLIQASDGNLYGLTSSGGANNSGTAFKLTTAGAESVLWSFGGAGDGATPTYASLIQGSDGNLYGLTSGGGSNHSGTLFKLTTSGTETIVHNFGGAGDGAIPYGGLIRASDGYFYGTTTAGGTFSEGTVFKIN